MKPKMRLFAEPLRFVAGELVLPPRFKPTINGDMLAAHEITCERFAPPKAGWAAQAN